MKKTVFLLLAAVMVFGLAACSQAVSGQNILQSDKPRNTDPAVDQNDLAALVNGNNAFAFDLYRAISGAEGNLFFSPHSISAALAMTYAGARTSTEKSMADALKFSLSQERLHPAFNRLDLQLKQRGEGAKGKDDGGFRLNVVNAIWGQKDFKFLPSYLDILSQNYGAGLRILDFANDPEPSRVTINDWVSEQTEGRIKDLIPSGVINPLTRLVLTNAIYFNAAWQSQFNENNTAEGQFNLVNGDSVTVPMMKQTGSFKYASGADYQAVEMPYDGRELSMVVLLPSAGQFDAFQKSLDGAAVSGIISHLESHQVALTMPRFSFESSLGLKKALTDLGMGTAFTDQADFSGMDGQRDLFIQDVLHKAFISVDENGTEAAAATAIIVGTTAMPAQPVEFKMDRPFLFLIRDIPTGTILFVGRVMDPVEK